MNQSRYYKRITSETKALDFNFKEMWQYRDLVLLLVKKDFISKYKQTILGPAWAVIQPLLTTIVFTFIFGNVANLAECGKVPTFLFYMIGNITWGYFAGCLTGTADTFRSNAAILGKVYFPRLIMPVSTVCSQIISYLIQVLLFGFFFLVYYFLPDYKIEMNTCAWLIPLFVLQMSILGLGCGTIISSVTTKYRDLQFLVSFGVQLWMYGSPVAYSVKIFSNNKVLYNIVRLNPMTSIIEVTRYGVLGEAAGNLDWSAYIISCVITAVIFLVGVVMFNKVEKTFMDTV